MVYIVTTRYRVGIFLSHFKARNYVEKVKGAHMQTKDSLGSAIASLKKVETAWDYPINWQMFRPNRTYQVLNDKQYMVLYTFHRIGFCHQEKFHDFVECNHFVRYRMRARLRYQEAVHMVFQMGALTEQSEQFGPKNPLCGKVYRRR